MKKPIRFRQFYTSINEYFDFTDDKGENKSDNC